MLLLDADPAHPIQPFPSPSMPDAALGTINVCGWRRKKPLVEQLLDKDGISILGITETKARYSHIAIRNYQLWQKPHRNTTVACGGVALAVRSSIPAVQYPVPDNLAHLQLVGATVHTRAGPVVVLVHYNPPQMPCLGDSSVT
ncbi:hypothetical protein CBL_21418 [Carabus blaptoides fortunei]